MISRYVLVEPDDTEQDTEYSDYDSAVQQARMQRCAVVERQYELADSSLVWTPDGSDTWPPK